MPAPKNDGWHACDVCAARLTVAIDTAMAVMCEQGLNDFDDEDGLLKDRKLIVTLAAALVGRGAA
jgi:hypothetical protein